MFIKNCFTKSGGSLGETGSTAHLFYNCGIIHVNKKESTDEFIFELATNSGAKDCINLDNYS